MRGGGQPTAFLRPQGLTHSGKPPRSFCELPSDSDCGKTQSKEKKVTNRKLPETQIAEKIEKSENIEKIANQVSRYRRKKLLECDKSGKARFWTMLCRSQKRESDIRENEVLLFHALETQNLFFIMISQKFSTSYFQYPTAPPVTGIM